MAAARLLGYVFLLCFAGKTTKWERGVIETSPSEVDFRVTRLMAFAACVSAETSFLFPHFTCSLISTNRSWQYMPCQ